MLSWSPTDLLPGLYVLALGVALAVLLKVLGDRLPVKAWAIFGALVLLILGPTLVGGKLLLPLDSLRGAAPFQMLAPTEPHGNLLQGDLIQLVLPLKSQARDEFLAGRWPLWNALAGAGMPLLADPQAQPLQPLAVIALPFDPLRGAAVTAALRILLALAFCCALFRRLGLETGPAVAGAVAYGCGGFLLLWLGWPLANSAALLPVALYAVAGCLVRRHGEGPAGRRQEIFLAVAAAALLLAGHPETILYAGSFVVAFTVHCLFLQSSGTRQVSGTETLRKRLSTVALPTLLAAAMVAPILLPTVRYLPHTWRAATVAEPGEAPHASVRPQGSDGDATSGPLARLVRTWVPLAAPNAFGNSRYVHYWGASNSNEDSSGFAGTTTLLVALLGVLGMAGRRKLFPAEGLAMAAALLVMGLLAISALGSGSFLRGVHGGGRLRLLFVFAVAYLAACGLERLQGKKHRSPRYLTCLLGLGLAFVGFHVFVFFGFPSPEGEGVLRELRFGWLHWHLRFLAAGVLLLAFAHRRRWMPWAMAALIAGELILAFQDANPPMPERLAFPTPAPLAAALNLSDEPRVVGLGGALPPNLAAVYGMADARIYNPMEPAPYAALVEPLLEHPRGNVPRAVVAEHPLYDLLGIRFVLTGPGVDLPLELVVDAPSGRLFRRPHPLDTLFLPASAASVSEASWPAAVHRAQDFAASSLVLTGGSGEELQSPSWKARPGATSQLSDVRQDGPRVRAVADLAERRLLASRLLALGSSSGWRLLSNGRRQATVRANGPLLAAWLPAGHQELNLFYRPPGFILGCALAALGVSLAFLRWWDAPGASEGIDS